MKKLKHPQPEIRKTTLEDVLALRTMHAQSWRDTYPNEGHGVSREWVEERTATWLTPEGIAKSKKHFADIFDNPDHLHEVAVTGGEVVGIMHASKVDGKQHLEALYIDKSQYGTGLAQRFMEQALEWFDSTQPITLEVAVYNDRAKAFYRKYGFEEAPGSDKKFAEKIPVVVMERKGNNDD